MSYARCTRCGSENPYQPADFVCWSCRNIWRSQEEDSLPPPPTNSDEAPETWPPHWKLEKSGWGHDVVRCLKHNETFAKTDKCSQCRSVAKAKATATSGPSVPQWFIGSWPPTGSSGQSTPLATPQAVTRTKIDRCKKHNCYFMAQCMWCALEAKQGGP